MVTLAIQTMTLRYFSDSNDDTSFLDAGFCYWAHFVFSRAPINRIIYHRQQ